MGLSKMGFMATSGTIFAAAAWWAMERATSWPPSVTKELSDMF